MSNVPHRIVVRIKTYTHTRISETEYTVANAALAQDCLL